jgi:hypothetical protein
MLTRPLILSTDELMTILGLIDSQREWLRRNRNKDDSVADIRNLDALTQRVKDQIEVRPLPRTLDDPSS